MFQKRKYLSPEFTLKRLVGFPSVPVGTGYAGYLQEVFQIVCEPTKNKFQLMKKFEKINLYFKHPRKLNFP